MKAQRIQTLPDISPAPILGTFFDVGVQVALKRHFSTKASGSDSDKALPIYIYMACEGLDFPESKSEWPDFKKTYRLWRRPSADILHAITLFISEPTENWSVIRRMAWVCDTSRDGKKLPTWREVANRMNEHGWNPRHNGGKAGEFYVDVERLRSEFSEEKKRRLEILAEWKPHIEAFNRIFRPVTAKGKTT